MRNNYIISVFAIFLIFTTGLAWSEEGAKLDHLTSMEKAFEKAKKENKHVFVDFWTTWCHWCKELDNKVFSDQEVIKYLNEKFVVVKINGDSQRDVTEKYKVTGFPNLLFLTSEDEELGRIPGFLPKDKFLQECEKIISVLELEKTVKENPDDIEAAYSLAAIYFDQDKYEQVIPLLERVSASESSFVKDKMEEIYTKFGLSLINSEQTEKGISYIMKTIDEYPEGTYREINIYNLIIFNAKLNNKEQSLSLIDKYEKEYPNGQFISRIPMVRKYLIE